MNENQKETEMIPANEILFSNTGKKIKKATIFLFWLEVIAAVITALVMFVLDSGRVGFFSAMGWICLASIIIFWFASLVLYGFGEIVDNAINPSEKD